MSADRFLLLLAAHHLPVPQTEFLFAPPRRWRFDYAFVPDLVAVEQEGGVWTQGRHTRGKGFEADCEKYAEAILRGWTVFRASPRQLLDGTVLGWLKESLGIVENARTAASSKELIRGAV